ncbi:bifunctional oligoribonuclease/PAP phosphatase NrnA [Alkalihalobacillus sp. BA299]|uniref:DHH family phosphoesterase n=1 Tax=Alkalihalobacillus sp. BA299 TaxID=2815938 RepID=UPI001ADC152A|nr:bifunctional oligoribonuclease/PAP phosphatase NrnA [Alkalihalobacillus sp. BA299]
MIEIILEKIEAYETIIIHRHERPDPDAIGSQAGLAQLIKSNSPNKKVYIVGEEDPSLSFLATMDEVEDSTYEGALVIVCDTANTERISDQRYNQGDFLIKIDHHPNEEPYGDIVWVDTSASSVSEMVVELYLEGKKNGYILTDDAAFLLYAGIVGDTGRFRYPNTTTKTHQYTGELLQFNIDQSAFYSTFYKKDLNLTRLEGYILQHFEVYDDGLGVMILTKDILKKFNVTANESSVLVNSFNDVEGLKAWVFFVEDSDSEDIRVRLRSKGPHIHQIAQKYRGGGHPMASGAKAKDWEETKYIIHDLHEVCKVDNKLS